MAKPRKPHPPTAAGPAAICKPGWLGHHRDSWIAAALALAALQFFAQFREPELTDSRYTMLAAEMLWLDGSLALDRALPEVLEAADRKAPTSADRAGGKAGAVPYQLQPLARSEAPDLARRLWLWYPRAPAVMAAGFVPLLHALGHSSLDARGRYDPAGEAAMQVRLAAWLCAVAVGLAYLLARTWLGPWSSAGLAAAFAVGSPLWSVGGRALWTHDWGLLCGLGVCLHLARAHVAGGRANPWLIGSLLALLYVCRPAFAVEIMAAIAYLAWRERKSALHVAAVGAGWAVAFGLWSQAQEGAALPDYFRHARLAPGHFWVGLYGVLASPSRGLLVYSPVLVPCVAALVVWRARVTHLAVVVWAAATVTGHAALLALYPNWWGGHSFGARLMFDTWPWSVVLAATGWSAAQARLASPWLAQAAFGAVVVAFAAIGAFIHYRGVTDPEPFRWNTWPRPINDDPKRALDWRLPQFMAGMWPQPLPDPVPRLASGQVLRPGDPATDLHFLEGWGNGEGSHRWTIARRARLVWQGPSAPGVLSIAVRPYLDMRLPSRGPKAQRIRYGIAGQPLRDAILAQPTAQRLRLELPAGPGPTVLVLETPDAAVPRHHGAGDDTRRLGVALHGLRLD
ncbi:MAG: hypothetical protein FJ100_13035 [Deltaproteobacteria bacterium]|nr:hypothetical protein [Deltaproteobacteria bacterium]